MAAAAPGQACRNRSRHQFRYSDQGRHIFKAAGTGAWGGDKRPMVQSGNFFGAHNSSVGNLMSHYQA